MNRRELLQNSAVLGMAATLPGVAARAQGLTAGPAGASAAAPLRPLQPPAGGSIPVAFVISDAAVVIDFCGPWEVFSNVTVAGRQEAPFALYTVAETSAAVSASGGMRIVPNHTYATAPQPRVIVIPAQSDPSAATLEWIRSATRATDVTMSVCTGAFVLAKTGLLDGKPATTHHGAYAMLAMRFPQVQVRRGVRFVEVGNLASAGGLSSGIDLALRVVGRYFGADVATQTAYYMEYQGQGWLDPDSNAVYRRHLVASAAHPLCPVCDMAVDPKSAPRSQLRGQTYYFCIPEHKAAFDAAPERFLEAVGA
jgi:YHS domain-containing protein/putative intracellular protease/amidase